MTQDLKSSSNQTQGRNMQWPTCDGSRGYFYTQLMSAPVSLQTTAGQDGYFPSYIELAGAIGAVGTPARSKPHAVTKEKSLEDLGHFAAARGSPQNLLQHYCTPPARYRSDGVVKYLESTSTPSREHERSARHSRLPSQQGHSS
jgi:hypothetical protein